MGLNNDIARSHLETLIERISGVEKATPDEQGNYFIKTESAGFFARVDGDVVQEFAELSCRRDGVDHGASRYPVPHHLP